MNTTRKVMVLLITSLTLYSCGGTTSSQQQAETNDGSLTIKRAGSNDELERYLKQSLIQNFTQQVNTPTYYELASVVNNDSGAAESPTKTFSTTNTQESTVDESDRLKTDGEYLYTSAIHQAEIRIYKADEHATPVSAKQLKTLNEATLSGLYLRAESKQLAAISGDGAPIYPLWDMWFGPHYWQDRKTDVFTLDISDPATPVQQAKLRLDGQLINSRRIGSTLYLATRYTPSPDGLITSPSNEAELSNNKRIINNASLNDMLPTYQLNDGSAQAIFENGDCFISDYSQPKYEQSSIISLLAIDLDDATLTPRGQCFAGDAETIYASSEALYLATTHYSYENHEGVATYTGLPSTEIHKFSLQGTTPNYVGSGSVPGHLGWQQDLKPFRMSEHNDILRVITYTGNNASSQSSPAHLYTLEENTNEKTLDILGSLPNESRPDPLGKTGEHIYATRFMGDRAYLVTFRVTDPLYIVDLSDPADPFIASELEINGYSDYLHPVGDNYLLGIGKDAVAATNIGDGRGAWYQGVKLSLIDVSNASAPFEKEQIILGKRGTETAVSQTHHALTSLLKGDALEVALPVSIHETPYDHQSSSENPSDTYAWTRNELYRLSVNTVSGDIETLPAIVAQNTTNEEEEPSYSWEWPYDRSAIIDDRIYYLHGDDILVK